MKSKRLISFILAGVMALMMCACGEEDLKAHVDKLAENTVADGEFTQEMDMDIKLSAESAPDETIAMGISVDADVTDYDPDDPTAMNMTGEISMNMFGESESIGFTYSDGKISYDDDSIDTSDMEFSPEQFLLAESILGEDNIVYERDGDVIKFTVDVTEGEMTDLFSTFGSDYEELGVEMGDLSVIGEITEKDDMLDTVICNCSTSMVAEGETINMEYEITVSYSK